MYTITFLNTRFQYLWEEFKQNKSDTLFNKKIGVLYIYYKIYKHT